MALEEMVQRLNEVEHSGRKSRCPVMRHLPRPTDGPYEVRSGDSACSGQDPG